MTDEQVRARTGSARTGGDGLTQDCSRVLAGWDAPGREQQALRQLYLDHLVAHPADGWSRTCPGAHLTASSLIVAPLDPDCPGGPDDPGDPDDSRGRVRVLLTLHRRIGRWLQTGGHLEADDTSLAAAALREAGEESGIRDLRLDPDPLLLSRHPVRCGPVDPCHHLDVQYLVHAPAGATIVRSAESADLRWFEPADHPGDATVRALVDAALLRVRTTSLRAAGNRYARTADQSNQGKRSDQSNQGDVSR